MINSCDSNAILALYIFQMQKSMYHKSRQLGLKW